MDLAHAGRSLRRRPGTLAIVVLVLGLGIGANAAVFTVVRDVLLTPLPYADPDRLVSLRHRYTGREGAPVQDVAGPDLADYVQGATSVEGAATVIVLRSNLGDDEGAARATLAWVNPEYFAVLGLEAAVGRALVPEDGAGIDIGRLGDPTYRPPPAPVVIGHALWVERYGADPTIVGRRLLANGSAMSVVGVLPEGVGLHLPASAGYPERVDVWAVMPGIERSGNRAGEGPGTVLRLRDGVTLDRARSELEAVAHGLRETHEAHARAGTEVVVGPLLPEVVGDARETLRFLAFAVLLVLMLATTNVMGLLLVRAHARRPEFAVKLSLGVGEGRLGRQLVLESLLIALASTAVAAAVAWWGVDGLQRLFGTSVPRLAGTDARGGTLAFGAALAFLVGIATGLAPAFVASRVTPSFGSRGTGGRTGPGTAVRNGLVVVEVAASCVLLVGAGLLGRSVQNLLRVDPGFESGSAVGLTVSLPLVGYATQEAREAFFGELARRVRTLPGVTAAGTATGLPLVDGGGGRYRAPIGPDGAELDAEGAARVDYRAVSAGYLEAIGVRVAAGRSFAEGDEAPDAEPVVVLDRRLAERYWPGGAVGETVRVFVAGYTGAPRTVDARVVGVTEPVRFVALAAPDPPPVYLPHAWFAPLEGSLAFTARGDPAVLVERVRTIVRELDPGVPVYGVTLMSEAVREAAPERRSALALVAVFSAVALLLATVGLYGVVSTLVQTRTRELGIRIAVGASRGRIAGIVLGRAALLVGAGIAVGLTVAGLTRSVLDSLLFEIGSADPWSVGGAVVVLAVAALAAAWIPTLRAGRLDPVTALRAE